MEQLIPQSIQKTDDLTLGINWSDGHNSRYNVIDLRKKCSCASCKDEWSGEKILLDEQVPDSVRPLSISPVGRYGLQITWSDGHNTGIYTFTYLRQICQCELCMQTFERSLICK